VRHRRQEPFGARPVRAEHDLVPGGEGRVQVVALAAFSEGDRDAFQTVFEQLVEVFSEHESVQRIVRRADGFDAFLDELVAVIDG
jgi:lichenan operon transcriptional antiterminator